MCALRRIHILIIIIITTKSCFGASVLLERHFEIVADNRNREGNQNDSYNFSVFPNRISICKYQDLRLFI